MKVKIVTYMYEDAPAIQLVPESEMESELLHHMIKKGAIFDSGSPNRNEPPMVGMVGVVRIPSERELRLKAAEENDE